MDKLIIRNLKAPTVIGLLDWERKVSQELRIDIDIFLDVSSAGQHDDFAQTVNYAAVADMLLAVCAQSKFELIEALAEHLSAVIFKSFELIESLKLTIKKPGAVPQADYVGVEIERSR